MQKFAHPDDAESKGSSPVYKWSMQCNIPKNTVKMSMQEVMLLKLIEMQKKYSKAKRVYSQLILIIIKV